jgi:hypothetical protein
MALITDLDLLADSATDNSSTEVYIDTTAKTIKLNTGVGDLIAADGVTLKAMWSFLKTQWHTDPNTKNLASFPFPMENITDEFFELIEGWNWANASTQQSLRNGGWLVRNTTGNVIEHWAGVKAIGDIAGTDQLYYNVADAATNFTFAGAVNEAVQIIDDPNGDGAYGDGFDYSASFEIYNREESKLYAKADLIDIGEATLLAPKAFSFAVGSGTDLNIIDTDANVSTIAPYTGMSITYHATAQDRSIGGATYSFGVIIEGNSATKQEIYTYVQYQLRLNADIDADADSKIGKIQDALLNFVGSAISTSNVTNPDGGGIGVFVDNFDTSEINDWSFQDNAAAIVSYPTLTPFTINFNDVAQGDSTFKYWVYMTDPDGTPANNDEWGTSGGLILEDDSSTPITGTAGGAASKTFTIAYDTSTQGGRTGGQDINVTVVGIGTEAGGAKYVRTTGIITNVASSVTLVANLDRQYENPA